MLARAALRRIVAAARNLSEGERPVNTDKERPKALVTGASSGIGRAFARRLAEDGWDLIVVARRREALEDLAQELARRGGASVEVLPADLTIAEDLARVETAVGQESRLELLVNNAGFGVECCFFQSGIERQASMIDLNVSALTRLSHAAVAAMVARGRGAVINVSSGAGFGPTPYFAVYGATKAFVTSFTEALHEELQGTGVRVQALCPGFTRTEFQQVAGTDAGRFPSFVWQTPEEVVAASLDGLRKGTLLCIPGLKNQALMAFRGPISRGVTRRLFGLAGRHNRK